MPLKIIDYFSDKQDEVVYYDPCESPEELKAIDQILGLQGGENAETRGLRRQCRQLERKRGRICARRAYLRSRKVGAGSFLYFPSRPFFIHER